MRTLSSGVLRKAAPLKAQWTGTKGGLKQNGPDLNSYGNPFRFARKVPGCRVVSTNPRLDGGARAKVRAAGPGS